MGFIILIFIIAILLARSGENGKRGIQGGYKPKLRGQTKHAQYYDESTLVDKGKRPPPPPRPTLKEIL